MLRGIGWIGWFCPTFGIPSQLIRLTQTGDGNEEPGLLYSSTSCRAEKTNESAVVKVVVKPGLLWPAMVASVARNVGTHLASGEVIASFDDDDLYAQTPA